jgi:hypothetical protein
VDTVVAYADPDKLFALATSTIDKITAVTPGGCGCSRGNGRAFGGW